MPVASPITIDDVEAVAPALAHFTRDAIIGGMWKRDALVPRDRSIVTVAALVAGERTIGFSHYFTLALQSGATPSELSEIVTHVAFYGGWSGAFSAVTVLKDIFAELGVTVSDLPPATAIAPAASETRQALPSARVSAGVSYLAARTAALLDGDLWQRPGLAVRDRHLVTLAALIATGHFEMLDAHARAAVEGGLSKGEISETVAHLAFYEGWPSAFSAAIALGDFLTE